MSKDVVVAIILNNLVNCISIVRLSQIFEINSSIIRQIINEWIRKYRTEDQQKRALLKRGNLKTIIYSNDLKLIWIKLDSIFTTVGIIHSSQKILITSNLLVNPVLRSISRLKLLNEPQIKPQFNIK